VDVRTSGLADGHLRPTLLGRLGGVELLNTDVGMLTAVNDIEYEIAATSNERSHSTISNNERSSLHNSTVAEPLPVRRRCQSRPEYNHLQVVSYLKYLYLICQMHTADKATTKQRTQWQDSKAQHALTTALDKKHTNITIIFRIRTVPSALQSINN